MRRLLFSHEIKAKRIKKIKSKTFHRQLKKNRLKSASSEVQMDPEAANEYAKKQEFKRAKEHMTLKHKNSSKWAKRILKRGLSIQDEGTRAAFSEQNHQGAVLTRKIESMKNDSSDDRSDEDEDDGSVDGEDSAMLLMRAKEKTLKVIEEEDEMPKKGVLSVSFMVKSGTLFENILICDDPEYVKKFAKETWGKQKDAEKAAFDEVEKKKEAEEELKR